VTDPTATPAAPAPAAPAAPGAPAAPAAPAAPGAPAAAATDPAERAATPTPTAPATAPGGAAPTPPPGSAGIDEILARARHRLKRLDPHAAAEALGRGAVLVDIRPAAQRAEFGEIPGAVVIERNVLEWRLDPRSDARLPFADDYDLEVIVTCQEGYTSSLAAASLQDLGLHRATDLTGGFAAWRAAGLPTSP
jgi:rhodanese-related sulfurtransferase